MRFSVSVCACCVMCARVVGVCVPCIRAVRLVCDSGTRPTIHCGTRSFAGKLFERIKIHHGHFIRHYLFEVSVFREE